MLLLKCGEPLIEPHTFGCGQASGRLLPAWRRLNVFLAVGVILLNPAKNLIAAT